MPSRFRHYGLFMGLLAVWGCGSGADNPKTPVVSTTAAANAAKTETKKPEEPTVKNDKVVEKGPDPVASPAPPKEKFALPNVDITPADERQKQTLAGKEISAEACLLDTSVPEMNDKWFSKAIRALAAAPDGSLYVLDHQAKVRHYIPEPGDTCKLAIDTKFGDKGILTFDGEPDDITVLDDGTIFAYSFMKSFYYRAGKIENADCQVRTLNPDGKTGFYYFVERANKVDVAAECKETPWKYTGWDPPAAKKGESVSPWSVVSMQPWGKDILVAMTLQGDYFLGMHSQDGKLKVKFGKDRDKDKNLKDGEDICSVGDVDACAAGICVVDANCRRLSAWDPKNGSMTEAIAIGDLLGLFYPWPVELVSTKGGVSYMAATHSERKPENPPADYEERSVAMIFRIKGLN